MAYDLKMGIEVLDHGGTVFHVKNPDYGGGATGDGATSDATAVGACHDDATASGGIMAFPAGTYIIDAADTWDADVTLLLSPGAIISVSTGVTLTMNCANIIADPSQHFSGAGTVDLSGSGVKDVCAEWWGITTAASSSTNDAAMLKMYGSLRPGMTVHWGFGTYTFDAVNLSSVGVKGIHWQGRGLHKGPSDWTGLTILKKDTAGTFSNTNTEHLFRDTASACDGWSIDGIEFDCSKASATAGDTVAAIFASRLNGLKVTNVMARDSIDSHFKLYKCQDVWFEGVWCDNARGNGIQNHAPSSDSYTGSRADQGWSRVTLLRCKFTNIDDGNDGGGEGQGCTFNNDVATVECSDAWVISCEADSCVRGFWCESNTSGAIMRNVNYIGCVAKNMISHGGMLGAVKDGSIIDCHAYNIGTSASVSSDLFGWGISGVSANKSERCTIADCSAYDDRAGSAQMEYGFRINQATGCTLSNPRSEGETTRPYQIIDTTCTDLSLEFGFPRAEALALFSSFSSADATENSVQWDSEQIDPLNVHDDTTNPERFELGDNLPGVWEIEANVVWGSNSTGFRRLRIQHKDGTTTTTIGESAAPAVNGAETSLHVISKPFAFTAGDWAEVTVYNNTGSSAALNARSWVRLRHTGSVSPS